jgi:hypothetical protein
MPTSSPFCSTGTRFTFATAHQCGENVDRGLIHHGNDRSGHDIACLPIAGCRDLLQADRIVVKEP